MAIRNLNGRLPTGRLSGCLSIVASDLPTDAMGLNGFASEVNWQRAFLTKEVVLIRFADCLLTAASASEWATHGMAKDSQRRAGTILHTIYTIQAPTSCQHRPPERAVEYG
jgi:hypothetical protein